jgi:hypothetical protein
MPRSLPAWLFVLGAAPFVGFLAWLLYWKIKIQADPEIRAVFRAGQRPRGFLALGSLPAVIAKPPRVLVLLALITSALWTAGTLLLLAQAVDSGRIEHYALQASPVRFWLRVGCLGVSMSGGIAVFSWGTWCLFSTPEERVRLTATVSRMMSGGLDDLVAKPRVVLLMYVVVISLGLLMVADSAVSGQIIGWTQPSRSADPAYFWGQIGFWVAMTGWVGARFVQELRNRFRKRPRVPTNAP